MVGEESEVPLEKDRPIFVSYAYAPSGKIFISYRRDDNSGFATAVYLRLEQEFGSKDLFMDVEGQIKPGDDFVKVLKDQVAQCDVLLAIIGERWLGARDEDGNRRLEKESDFVRIEISSALSLGKRVIPVLVNEAEMPRADELPQSLKSLAHRNAVAIRPTRFKADSQGLINALKDSLAAAQAELAAESEAHRQVLEQERRRRQAGEEARAVRVEAAARKKAEAGLTSEEIRKAEELANWDFIKDSANPDEFRDHIARFASGTTSRFARKKLEALLWEDPATRASIDALREFIDEFPKGDHLAQAQSDLAALEKAAEAAREAEERRRAETEDWANVAAGTLITDFEAFLKKWPKGVYAADAKARIKASLFPRWFDPVLTQSVKPLFTGEDYDTAIFRAFKEVEERTRKKAGLSDGDYGIELMKKAFGPPGPLADKSAPKSEQERMRDLFVGAIGTYKNPSSHRQVHFSDPVEVVDVLCLANQLLRIVDRAECTSQ